MNCSGFLGSDSKCHGIWSLYMNEEQYLEQVTKHLQAMDDSSDDTPQYQASMLLAQSYMILYNAQLGPDAQMTLAQVNNGYRLQERV